jgi:hypothetical protein
LERGKLVTAAVMWRASLESGEGHSSCKKDGNCKRQVGLYTGENKRDMCPGEL